ncbi:DASH family cryptochrome [Pseudoalteromonas sp. SSDWG2]|uniref:DASH family cryptochrome n=1 Tax=Pseudoalteromonas sp. SSDWG2 TaxID=3139391 RepID=UPI003BAC79E1
MKTGLYLFTNDLRLGDNPLLRQLSKQCDRIIFAYAPLHFLRPVHHSAYPRQNSSQALRAFKQQTLLALSDELTHYGHVLYDINCFAQLTQIIQSHKVTDIGVAFQHGWHESFAVEKLTRRLQGITIHQAYNHTLFHKEQLPFALEDIPLTFSQFRKKIEGQVPVDPSLGKPLSLPDSVNCDLNHAVSLEHFYLQLQPWFSQSASEALTRYFATTAPSTYKQTRNALWGDNFSTGLSPWLANGSLSARQVYSALIAYEGEHGANDSTYWIYFELLWREYFQWLALYQKESLFSFKGMAKQSPNNTFYAERFQAWCNGNTEYPLVNALMNQLKQTGWMSNRGRQIVASCFINELGLDWRYGAAYFEHQLIDYDVASNYGNWQYIAGVGADPRGGRHFNIEKQTQMFDPDGEFTNHYHGKKVQIPERDCVGWPQS